MWATDGPRWARVESSVVAPYIYLQPVIATTLAGAVLIFVAIYLALRPSTRQEPA